MKLYIEEPVMFDITEHLGMTVPGRSGRVRHLDDLRGLVNIKTADTALHFVRLGTCLLRWDVEVLTKAEYAAQPHWYHTFLWNPWGVGETEARAQLEARTRLEPLTFKNLGFEAARVEAIEGGFRILRWIYDAPPLRESEMWHETQQGTYQKISETVTSDGNYTRAILEQRTALENEHLRPASGPNSTDPSELLRPHP